jgi:hypothetical protein
MRIPLSFLWDPRGRAKLERHVSVEAFRHRAEILLKQRALRLCEFCHRRRCIEGRRSRDRCWKNFRPTRYKR